ncbi:flagellar basal-body rod protein FlgC [Clostridia bacterium]|nr:flagellar basal-body rod protein FlgC [Clostridia bacterium]
MGFLSRLDIPMSGMMAERLRADVIAQNIANANTTRTAEGGPYRRQLTVMAENKPYANIDTSKNIPFGSVLALTMKERMMKKMAGVQVVEIAVDETPFTPVYDPTHPDSDENGYYYKPNVDLAEEQMDMMAATRSWEANNAIYEGLMSLSQKALTIGRG